MVFAAHATKALSPKREDASTGLPVASRDFDGFGERGKIDAGRKHDLEAGSLPNVIANVEQIFAKLDRRHGLDEEYGIQRSSGHTSRLSDARETPEANIGFLNDKRQESSPIGAVPC